MNCPSEQRRTISTKFCARLFSLALVCSSVVAQRTVKKTIIAEYREDGTNFQPLVSLSPAVLRVLVQQPQMAYLRDTKEPHPENFFKATAIQLNPANTEEVDLLVKGDKTPVTGADNDWFWIVTHAEGKPRVVLYTNGLSVAIFAKVHNGLRDVQSSWNSPNEFIEKSYRYDGKRYLLVGTKDGPFNPGL